MVDHPNGIYKKNASTIPMQQRQYEHEYYSIHVDQR